MEPLGQVGRILVVAAHPDDVDFGAAGSVAKWISQGTEVIYAIVTDGGAGGFDPNIERSKMPSIRRSEQVAAAKVVGVDQVDFLGYLDGDLVQVNHPGAKAPGASGGPSCRVLPGLVVLKGGGARCRRAKRATSRCFFSLPKNRSHRFFE